MSEQERVVKFWDCRADAEILQHDNISSAVEYHIDDTVFLGPITETIKVYGYAPMELPGVDDIAERVLQELAEWLDDPHADEYGHFADQFGSTVVNDAAEAFAKVVRANVNSWMCEVVETREVTVADHVPASWLENK